MILGCLPLLLSAQHRYAKNDLGNYYGISAEAGVTTFFGDIDDGPAQGSYTNNLAYKIKASWNIKKIVDFSGRISVGKISGEKKRTSGGKTTYNYFKTEFVEYTFDLGINLLAPILKEKREKFGLYFNVGLGLIDFKVKLFDGTNDSVVQSYGYDGQQSTTEFVLPFGGRFIYHISPASAVCIQTTLSQVNTDKLDGKTGNDNTDFYNYLSVGYTYKINTGQTKKRGSGASRLNKSRSRYR